MGFFSKIKDNFTHGGVDVHLNAPPTTSMTDAFLDVSIEISAKDSSHTINSVAVELVAESRDKVFTPGASSSEPMPEIKTVARAENNQSFTINAGQTQLVNLQIVMNSGEAAKENLPENGAMQSIAQGLSSLSNFANAMSQKSYRYSIRAIADVDGIAFDPSDTRDIKVLKPGQIGSGFNLGN